MPNIPKRRCVSCMQMKPKSTLLKVVKSKDGEIKIDVRQKLEGRGAYICKNAECLDNCKKKNRLNMAFKMNVDKRIYEDLEKEL
ncbi:MAG: YlxR family protein [Clostridia bacterium]|nr:YlxR family protein [Clostridia bacterium]